ncbi:MAG: hypothetical protein GX640_22760, partial [Fibrobacter sp.]|nr:hypothetical protein [Fibrobacter sp.]
MYNRHFYAVKLVFLILSSIITSVSAQPSLAILPIAYSGISHGDVKPLTEKIRYEISKDTAFKVMARDEMELMLGDQGFDLSKPCTDLACGISMGQLLSVDQLISGSI